MLALEVLASATTHFEPSQLIGIPFALVGAVFMSVGAQLQHSGVGKVDEQTESDGKSALNIKQLFALLSRPSWLFGTVMLGLAVVFQLVSLGYSPIIVVQPIGAVALVLTAIINSRVSKVKLNKASIIAITMCVGGIALFVTVAAFTAVNAPVLPEDLVQILIILGFIMLIFAVLYMILRHRPSALFYILGAGVLYGFVATLAKVVEARLFSNHMDFLLWIALAALLIAAVIGGLFVQNAYSSGPPDLVIAGLTVIDPLVAVCIGIVILDEASQAPGWAIAVYVIAGAIAVAGVFLMARVHPQSTGDTGEVPRLANPVIK